MMSMKQLFSAFLLAGVLLLAACSEKKKAVEQGNLAAQAAKHYYELLLKGKYDAFLNAENRPDRLPDTYREQLLINLRKFIAVQDSVHHGINSVSIGSSVFTGKDSAASVFLLFHYGDKTTEQVIVPMVKKKGKWIMR